MFSRLPRLSLFACCAFLAACSPVVPSDANPASSSSSSIQSSASSEAIVTSPEPNALVTSPLTVSGKAQNTWFFEASLPVGLLDADGNEIVMIGAMTSEDWMSDGMHAFETMLAFTTSAKSGFVVVRKDNPSGDPERDDEVRIPVRFK